MGSDITRNGKLNLDNSEARQPFQLYGRMKQAGVLPKNIAEIPTDRIRIDFQGGNVVFAQSWGYVWNRLENDADTKVKGKVGVTILPHDKGGKSATCIGGWQLAVSAFSKNKQEAVKFVRYLSSPTSLHSIDNANPAAGEQWAGLANYARAFDDDRFWHSLWQTVVYVVVTVPAALAVGLGLALLANQPFKVKWPVRLGLLLPWALPLVFAGLIFRWFFEYQTGIVNDVLVHLGGEPLPWLSSPTLATIAICIAIVWKSSSFMALMLLAGLQSIPRSTRGTNSCWLLR
jgi:hypothetical protein